MNVYAMKTKETDIAITKEVDVKKKECSRSQKWSKIARFSSVDCVSQNTKLVKVACQPAKYLLVVFTRKKDFAKGNLSWKTRQGNVPANSFTRASKNLLR